MDVTSKKSLTYTALGIGFLTLISSFFEPIGDARKSAHGNSSGISDERLAAIAMAEVPLISPFEVARRIKNRDSTMLVIDLRSADLFDDLHLPGSENATVPELALADIPHNMELVLVADELLTTEKAGMLLRIKGHKLVFAIQNGMQGWVDHILGSKIPKSPNSVRKVLYDELVDLSRYFGGQPSYANSPDEVTPVEIMPDSLRKAFTFDKNLTGSDRYGRKGC